MSDDKHGWDANGHPLDPRHHWNIPNQETPEEWKNRIIRSRLQMYERAARAGSLPAVADAVADCAEFGVSPPSWLVQAVTKIVMLQLRAPIPGAKGRFSTREAVLRNDLVHYERWDAVVELRERDDSLSWKKTFVAVSEILKGDAAGSKDTIEASYKKIQKGVRKRSGGASGLPYVSHRLKKLG